MGLEFARWELKDPSRVAPLLAGKSRRGIYVLEYSDGSRYVGQTTDIVRRYYNHFHGSNHHEAWTDVKALNFAAVPEEETLDGYEQETIHLLDNHGVPLRNRALVRDSVSGSPLDHVVTVTEQDHWLMGNKSACRSDFEAHQLRQRIKPGRFKNWSHKKKKRGRRAIYDAVLNDLAVAIGCLIPAPLDTDGKYWTLSDYPSTSGGRFATLNTGRLEFLYFPRRVLGDFTWSPSTFTAKELQTFTGHLNIEPSLLDGIYPEFWAKDPLPDGNIWFDAQAFYTDRTTRCIVYPIGHLGELLLERPDVMRRAREFALKEMRYADSNIFSRWHSRDFRDDVYRRIKQSPEIIEAVNNTVAGDSWVPGS